MTVKILRTEVKGINIIGDERLIFDFFAEKNVNENSKISNDVSHLFSTTYSLNAIGIIGINASGKTTSLRIMEFIFQTYLYRERINKRDSRGPFNGSDWLISLIDDKLEMITYFYDGSNIHKIISIIGKKKEGPVTNLFFEEEYIYVKKVAARLSKANLFEFNESHLEVVRSLTEGADFLGFDDSIFMKHILEYVEETPHDYVSSLLIDTNYNILLPSFDYGSSSYGPREINLDLVKYLDPSIEKLEFIEEPLNKGAFPEYVRLKFSGKPEIETRFIFLEQYLSSGTMKGINIITRARDALKTGGYLIIDEIENHLNKSIVIQIINFFMGPLNKKGATIIFTTHYSEIIDILPRTDSIYVLLKDGDIKLSKMSYLLDDKNMDRSDKKKSEFLLSGEIATMPSYKRYRNLYFAMLDSLNRGDEN